MPDHKPILHETEFAVPARRGWWLVGPDGQAYGPFKRREIATRWRRFRMYRRYANGTLRASWEKAGESPFVGKAAA